RDRAGALIGADHHALHAAGPADDRLDVAAAGLDDVHAPGAGLDAADEPLPRLGADWPAGNEVQLIVGVGEGGLDERGLGGGCGNELDKRAARERGVDPGSGGGFDHGGESNGVDAARARGAGAWARKFASRRGPSSVRKLSGWNCTPSSGALSG